MSFMTATERLRELLDERGVEWTSSRYSGARHAEHTKWRTKRGHHARFSEFNDGQLALVIDAPSITPEQAIAVTLGDTDATGERQHGAATCETFTIGEIEALYNDLLNSDGGSLAATVDGETYETDWGYGIEGIMHFIEMLKRRHKIEVSA